MSNPSVIVKLFDEEVQKMCDEAFERGLKAGQENQTEPATEDEDATYNVQCTADFQIYCEDPVTEEVALKACYLAALDAAIKFGRNQGLDYCDIECDLSDAYDRIVEQEVE